MATETITRDLWIYMISNPQDIRLYHRQVVSGKYAHSIRIKDLHCSFDVNDINTTHKLYGLHFEYNPRIILDHRDDQYVANVLRKIQRKKLKEYQTLLKKIEDPIEFTEFGDSYRWSLKKHFVWTFLLGKFQGLGCYSKTQWHKERNTNKIYAQWGYFPANRLYFTFEHSMDRVIEQKDYLFIILMTELDKNKAYTLYKEYLTAQCEFLSSNEAPLQLAYVEE